MSAQQFTPQKQIKLLWPFEINKAKDFPPLSVFFFSRLRNEARPQGK